MEQEAGDLSGSTRTNSVKVCFKDGVTPKVGEDSQSMVKGGLVLAPVTQTGDIILEPGRDFLKCSQGGGNRGPDHGHWGAIS